VTLRLPGSSKKGGKPSADAAAANLTCSEDAAAGHRPEADVTRPGWLAS
jgi:hypothetical protein